MTVIYFKLQNKIKTSRSIIPVDFNISQLITRSEGGNDQSDGECSGYGSQQHESCNCTAERCGKAAPQHTEERQCGRLLPSYSVFSVQTFVS